MDKWSCKCPWLSCSLADNPRRYTGAFLLKQGYYSYYYWGTDGDGRSVVPLNRGDFYQTQNEYTVLLYHRSPVRSAHALDWGDNRWKAMTKVSRSDHSSCRYIKPWPIHRSFITTIFLNKCLTSFFLDSETLNHDDISWEPISSLGEFKTYNQCLPHEILEKAEMLTLSSLTKCVFQRRSSLCCQS